MVSVDSTSSGASSCAFRITSERAQSSDSETDGSFRRSIARIFWTAATTAPEPLGDLRNFESDDRQLVGGRREVDEQVQAPALEAVGELARVVGRQHNERDMPGRHGPELRHGHLEVREHLEQE